MFSVHTEKLARFSSSLQQTKKQLHLRHVHHQLVPLMTTHANTYLLQELYGNILKLESDLSVSVTHFQNGILQYTKLEQALLDATHSVANHSLHQRAHPFVPTREHNKRNTAYITKQKNKGTHHKYTSLHVDKSFIDYVNNGLYGAVYGEFSAYQFEAGKNFAYAQGSVGATLGSVHGALDVSGRLFDKGKLLPTLHLESEVGASLANVKGRIGIGNAYVHAMGEASLAVGAITGCAKAVLKKHEVSVKAEIGAAAVRGEVRGTISIFGIKISTVGIGELGAAGVSAMFSSKTGEFEFGGKASFLAGLGFKIKVTY